jgi:hypothetical protein
MFHDHISMPEASRQHLIGESRAFPNPRFDKLLEDASYEDLIWLDGALSDQLDGLPHYVANDVERREMFVQISDRLALVRRFSDAHGNSRRRLTRHSRLWTLASVMLAASILIAGTLVANR